MVRRAGDNGDIKDVDESLDEIREELDELKRELNACEDWTAEDQADTDEGGAAAEAHDVEFMDLEDEANALGIIANEMRKVSLDQGQLGTGEYPAGTYHG
jgi:chromosome segregation ATPase